MNAENNGRRASSNSNSNFSEQIAELLRDATGSESSVESATDHGVVPSNVAQVLLAALRQQQQLQPALGAAAATMDRDASMQAQALLMHHEEQLRVTRLFLEKQRGNQHGNPFLLASNAISAAKEAQNSILRAFGRSAPASASEASESTSRTQSEEKSATLVSMPGANNGNFINHQESSREDKIEEESTEDEAGGDGKVVVKKSAKESNIGDLEDYGGDEVDDDKLSDEEYFRNFALNEDDRVVQESFPLKLYRMLYEVKKRDRGHIVSFLSRGKSFAVHKPVAFVEDVMPKYFTTCRLASFQRQLNLYGFRRITEGREKGAYAHDYFVRGERALCRKITRQKTRVKAVKNTNQSHQGGSLSSLVITRQSMSNTLRSTANLPHLLSGIGSASTPAVQSLLASNPHDFGLESVDSLLGGLSGFGAPTGVGGDTNYSVLQQALQRNLLSGGNNVLHRASLLANQDGQQQGQETELLLQRLRQQQAQVQRQEKS